MNEIALDLEFHGRKKLSSLRKKAKYISGIILILFGLFGLSQPNFGLNLYWYLLIAIGILNIIHGLFGKELIKVKNYISIDSKNVEYKNSFRKSKKINLNDLLDLRIETCSVEFVLSDQRVEPYDFSVFQKNEPDAIYKELEMLKAKLIE